MPIYAYRCETCGFAKDVLQKISDPVLTDCLSCGQPTFKKQVTAAGFQLKGTGWYATDFKGGNTSAPAVKTDAGEAAKTDAGKTEPAAKSEAKTDAPASTAASTTPASNS
jgi:putative FmdB family regulatory protein